MRNELIRIDLITRDSIRADQNRQRQMIMEQITRRIKRIDFDWMKPSN